MYGLQCYQAKLLDHAIMAFRQRAVDKKRLILVA